jgi:hypothetical protein
LNGFSIEFSAEAVIHPETENSGGMMSGTFDQQPFMIAILNLKKIFSPPMPGAPGSWLPEHRQENSRMKRAPRGRIAPGVNFSKQNLRNK